MSVPSAAAPIEFVIVGLTQDGKRFRPSDWDAQLEREGAAPQHGVLGVA